MSSPKMRSTTTNRSQSRPLNLKNLRSLLFCFALTVVSQTLFAQTSGSNPLVRFHTDLGDIDVALLQDIAPNNVANFLGYVNPGIYDNSIFHRSVPTFVIQGGGYTFANNTFTALAVHAAVVNEFHVSNTRGTLAMAKLANDPNSATNNWFFNESDSNASNLDNQDGGFTVFGRIITSTGLTTMDTIAAVPVFSDPNPPTFDSLPLRNYTSGAIQNANLVHVIWVKVVPQITALTHPSANTIHVQGVGGASKSYQLQTSSTPAASGFTSLSVVHADTNGNITFDDTSAGTKKFYRLIIP
jgi:cyclophilin family peptidyl-prolyl cis-trans isomerase